MGIRILIVSLIGCGGLALYYTGYDALAAVTFVCAAYLVGLADGIRHGSKSGSGHGERT